MNIWKLNIYALVTLLIKFKIIKIYKKFTLVSLDKKPGGISKMIEASSRALSLKCEAINIF